MDEILVFMLGALTGVYRKEIYELAIKGLTWLTTPTKKDGKNDKV